MLEPKIWVVLRWRRFTRELPTQSEKPFGSPAGEQSILCKSIWRWRCLNEHCVLFEFLDLNSLHLRSSSICHCVMFEWRVLTCHIVSIQEFIEMDEVNNAMPDVSSIVSSQYAFFDLPGMRWTGCGFHDATLTASAPKHSSCVIFMVSWHTCNTFEIEKEILKDAWSIMKH